MKIGTIGAGTVALAFARQALAAGHQVVLSNSRGPASLQPLVAELGRGASTGTREEAASAEMVLLAVPWPLIPQALAGLPAWDGRILIDATNQFTSLTPAVVADLGNTTGSEFVARLAPGARVVKALNTLFAEYINTPGARRGASSSSTRETTQRRRPRSPRSLRSSDSSPSMSATCATAAS